MNRFLKQASENKNTPPSKAELGAGIGATTAMLMANGPKVHPKNHGKAALLTGGAGLAGGAAGGLAGYVYDKAKNGTEKEAFEGMRERMNKIANAYENENEHLNAAIAGGAAVGMTGAAGGAVRGADKRMKADTPFHEEAARRGVKLDAGRNFEAKTKDLDLPNDMHEFDRQQALRANAMAHGNANLRQHPHYRASMNHSLNAGAKRGGAIGGALGLAGGAAAAYGGSRVADQLEEKYAFRIIREEMSKIAHAYE